MSGGGKRNASGPAHPPQLSTGALSRRGIGNFGDSFDELHDAVQKSLPLLLAHLRMPQGHAWKHHRAKMAEAVAALFHETADPQINWVKETVFGVKDGAPLLSGTHPVMEELMKGPFLKGAHVPSLVLMSGTLTPSDRPCRREAAGTFREEQSG